jgi:hypothetical protein
MISHPQVGCGFLNDIFDNEASNWIWLQFTGLYDKNGKEIYEGDICKQFGTTEAVVYGLGGFGYQLKEWDFVFYGHNYHFGWEDNKSDKIEVIGNIYESPKLLESEGE